MIARTKVYGARGSADSCAFGALPLPLHSHTESCLFLALRPAIFHQPYYSSTAAATISAGKTRVQVGE